MPVKAPGPLAKAQCDIESFGIPAANSTRSIIAGNNRVCWRGATSNSLNI